MISIILIAVLTLAAIFLLGFGLTLFFIPEKLKLCAFWLTPWFAIFFLVFFLVFTSFFGFSVRQSSPLAIVIMVFFGIWTIWKGKKHYHFNFKEDIILLFVVILSILFNLSPLIRQEKTLTTVSLGNNDTIVYVVSPDFMLDQSIAADFLQKPDPLKPGLISVHNLNHSSYRWGPPIVTAFFMNMFKLKGYQYFYLFQTIIFALTLPLIYTLMKLIYKSSILGLVLVLGLTSLNANMLYIIYHDFFGQVFFWALELFLLILFYVHFFSSEEKSPKPTIDHYLIAVTISVLYLSYHEGAIFIIGPLFLLLFFRLFAHKSIGVYWSLLMKIAVVVSLTAPFIIINGLVLSAVQAGNTGGVIGWQLFRSRLPYANPFEMMGFYSIHSFSPLPFAIALILSLATVFVVGVGFWKSKKRLIGASYIVLFLLFFIWTGPIDKNFFTYNRVVTYTLPLFLIFFTIGIVHLLRRYKFWLTITVITLVGLELYSGVKLNKRFLKEHIVIDQSLISLRQLNDDKNIREPIYTEQAFTGLISLWPQMWTDYFLYPDKNIYSPFNFNGKTNKVKDGSLVLLSKTARFYQPPKILVNDIVWENEYYKLGRLCQSDQCLTAFKNELAEIIMGQNDYEDTLLIDGWHRSEGDHRWASGLTAKVRLVSRKKYTKLILEAHSLKTPQTISVYLDGKLLGSKEITTDWQKYQFNLKKISDTIHMIDLKFSHLYKPSDIGINDDQREMSAHFREIRFN